MKIRLLVIGTRPEDWVRDAVSLYLARLPAHLKPELVEIPLSLRSSGGDPAVAKAKEDGKQPPQRPRDPQIPTSNPHYPCVLFNAMIAPMSMGMPTKAGIRAVMDCFVAPIASQAK